MTNEKKGLQNTLNSAKEALTKINKEKFPKLYGSKEGEVKALEIALDKTRWVKKVEKDLKDNPPQEKITPKNEEEKDTPKKSEFSLQDIRALADVHDEDVESVVKFSKLEDISISEAKKHSDMQAILKNREEHRKIADATNTKGGRRGPTQVSGKSLLEKAEETGDMPESDADIDKLVDARLERQMKSKR